MRRLKCGASVAFRWASSILSPDCNRRSGRFFLFLIKFRLCLPSVVMVALFGYPTRKSTVFLLAVEAVCDAHLPACWLVCPRRCVRDI